METDQGMITEQDAIMKHVVQFYKELFGPIDSRNIFLSNNFWESNRKVNAEDRENLIKLFTEKEIKQSIFYMKKDAALGRNGFGATFCNTLKLASF